jgi:cytochrome c-type biogenesis protein CcmH/NrfG
LIGYAYYLRNDPISALRFLNRSIHADPGYAPARLHLGLLFVTQNNLGDGVQQLEMAIQLAPDSPTASQAANILQQYAP